MHPWASKAIFYHIYPLGLCGAPLYNDFSAPPTPRLEQLYHWLDAIQSLGANALYLGPLFESSSHGYDTADYYHVDRRLGDRATLARLGSELKRRGLRLVLDAVFNHVGRHFWAFRNVQQNGAASPYRAWFHNLRFDRRSPYGDPFGYEGWSGHYDLVKLNPGNPQVREHLFGAVDLWVNEFGADGLRLDAADCLDADFIADLAGFCRRLRPDFWLVGEVVNGDYRRLAGPGLLDSVTNYECYKGLYSSHNDHNYFEIAYSLNRQSGAGGIYRDLRLYNFADNHDVDRVVSRLADPRHLWPLYALLFSMPGIPSIYYGSEWGLEGRRTPTSDRALRPALENPPGSYSALRLPHPELAAYIARLAQVRSQSVALQDGTYQLLLVEHEQFVFLRSAARERVLAAFNNAGQAVECSFELPGAGRLVDLLNPPEQLTLQNGRCTLFLPPGAGRILRVEV